MNVLVVRKGTKLSEWLNHPGRPEARWCLMCESSFIPERGVKFCESCLERGGWLV